MAGALLLVMGTALALSAGVAAGRVAPLASVSPEAKAVEDGSLTSGDIVGLAFRLGLDTPSEVYCASWDADTQGWVNDTALGPIRTPGPAQLPPPGDYEESLASKICGVGVEAGNALVSALAAGGDAARDAMAVLARGPCARRGAFPGEYSAFFNATELVNASTAFPAVENFVAAAVELGLGACATVVSLDSEGSLLDSETLSTAQNSGGTGAGPGPGPGPGPSSGGDALPEGEVRVAITANGKAAQCLDYAPGSPGGWTNDSSPGWSGTGIASPDVLDVQQFALDVCSSPKAADAILEALAAGGSQARAAVEALLTNACNNQTATDEALQAFLRSPEMSNSTTVLSYAGSFVGACDELGLGCCISIVVLEPGTGEVLDARKIHTSGGNGGGSGYRPPYSEPPPASGPSSPLPAAVPPPASGNNGGSSAALEQCKAQLSAASSGCSGTAIVPGSSCCNAVLALGSGCLALLAEAASQPGADPILALAVDTLISKCDPPLGGAPPASGSAPPAPASPPPVDACQGDAQAQFRAALGKCNATSLYPGTRCCDGIQALGSGCLGEVVAAAAANATQAYLVKGVLDGCAIQVPGGADAPPARPAPPSPSGGPPAPDGPPASLPEGSALTFLSMSPNSATCYTYSPATGRFVNTSTSSVWAASGSNDNPPSDAAITAAVDQLCLGSPAGAAFLQAVGQGGDVATTWVTAWFVADCAAADDAIQAVLGVLLREGPRAAIAFAQRWVDACEELGIGACVTVTSVDSSGAVLGEVQVHTDVPVPGGPAALGGMALLHSRRVGYPN